MDNLRCVWRWVLAHTYGLSMAVVLVVFLAGTVYALLLGDRLRFPDERDYFALATNLRRNARYSLDGFTPTAFRAPGYPLLLALVGFLSPTVLAMRFVNVVALAVAVVLLGRMLRREVSPLAGLLATVLAAGYPILLYLAGTLYPQILAACLLVATLDRVTDARRTREFILAGLLMGALILTVPTAAVVALIVVAWIVAVRHHALRIIAVFLLASTAVVAPWIVRNYVSFDAFVFVASNGGLNLLYGNSPNTTPNAGVNVDISQYEAIGNTLGEIERDRYYRTEALDYIREHKLRSVTLYVQKLFNHFNYRNQLWTQEEASRTNDALMLVTYGPLLLITLLRIACFRRAPMSRIELLFLSIYLVNALFAALFFTRIRFRVPFDLLVVGMVAIALTHLRTLWHNANTRTCTVRGR